MESLFYSLTPTQISSLGVCSSTGSPVALIIADHSDADTKELFSTIIASGITFMLGACGMEIAGSCYEDMKVAKQYVQSLSKEELEELSKDLSGIVDNQETEKLCQQMAIIEQEIGELDSRFIDYARREIICSYLDSLTIEEFRDFFGQSDDIIDLLPPEQRVEKRLHLTK